LCFHLWGAHEHPSLMSPDKATPGNGLLLFFRVDDFDRALKRARTLVTRLEEEPHVNPNTQTAEFSLRDPDGYYVTISALSAPRPARRRPTKRLHANSQPPGENMKKSDASQGQSPHTRHFSVVARRHHLHGWSLQECREADLRQGRKDPARLFNASLEGHVRRAIDIHEGEDVDASAFKALVRQAVALNGSGKSKASKKAQS
jgi:hypothetical protein